MTIRVTLDIFSGRPNPAWELDERQAAELERLIRALPALDEPAPLPVLGYGGVTAFVGIGDREGAITFFDGRAVLSDPNGPDKLLRDTDRAVERWLLETGRPVVAPEIFRLTPWA